MPFQDRVCVPSSVPVEGGVACAAGLRSTFFAPYEMTLTLTHMDDHPSLAWLRVISVQTSVTLIQNPTKAANVSCMGYWA